MSVKTVELPYSIWSEAGYIGLTLADLVRLTRMFALRYANTANADDLKLLSLWAQVTSEAPGDWDIPPQCLRNTVLHLRAIIDLLPGQQKNTAWNDWVKLHNRLNISLKKQTPVALKSIAPQGKKTHGK